MEDDLNQNGRQPHQKWKTTSPKMEDDLTQNVRRPKMKTTQNEDDQQGRSTVGTGILYHRVRYCLVLAWSFNTSLW